MRIFLVSMILVFLFSSPLYALRPSEEEINEDNVSAQIEHEAGRILEEKKEITEKMISVRQEREKTLRPYVSDTGSPYNETAVRHAVSTEDSAVPSDPAAAGTDGSRPIFNFVFFFAIAAVVLIAYFFIRPKSR